MNWVRIDDLTDAGYVRVRYGLVGYDFEIRATASGVQLTGTTPIYTDYTPVQEKLSWAQYQSQRIRETGRAIPQAFLDRGEM